MRTAQGLSSGRIIAAKTEAALCAGINHEQQCALSVPKEARCGRQKDVLKKPIRKFKAEGITCRLPRKWLPGGSSWSTAALTDARQGCQTNTWNRSHLFAFLFLPGSFPHVAECFDHDRSRNGLLFPDCSRVVAERQERRLGRCFRRARQPDGLWPKGSRLGSLSRHHLVGDHLHAHVDYALDFCSATNRADVRAFGRAASADQVAAKCARSVRTADGSAKPGTDAEIICSWRTGRPRPATHLGAGSFDFAQGGLARTPVAL